MRNWRRPGPLSRLAFAAVALITALSFLGRWYYPLDILSHFRVHVAALCFMLVIAALLVLRWRMALAATALMSLNLLTLAPVATVPVTAPAPGQTEVTLVTFNLWGRNPDLDLAIRVLAGTNADIILLQEVHPHARGLLDALKKAYPFQKTCETIPFCDGVILSRWPWSASGVYGPNARRAPTVWATFTRDGRSFTVAGTHLDRPPSSRHRRQIGDFATTLAQLPRPLVLAGDFNATPWSHAMTRLITETALLPLAGLRPTWPANLGFPQLPIDHVLVSGEWRNLGIRRGPFAGSDHRPIIARLALGPLP